MFDFIFEISIRIISEVGYLGICVLMIMESMIFPVPSEAVMPFAGFLILKNNQFTWLGVLVASSLGSMIGSYASYYIGLYGGRPFLQRYGKFFLLDKEHFDMSERFFAKYGDKAILISRFIPVVRRFISLPAGACQMNQSKFFIYTLLGASCWNMFLAWVGYLLAENWMNIKKYTHYLDYLVVLTLVICLAVYIYKQKKKS